MGFSGGSMPSAYGQQQFGPHGGLGGNVTHGTQLQESQMYENLATTLPPNATSDYPGDYASLSVEWGRGASRGERRHFEVDVPAHAHNATAASCVAPSLAPFFAPSLAEGGWRRARWLSYAVRANVTVSQNGGGK